MKKQQPGAKLTPVDHNQIGAILKQQAADLYALDKKLKAALAGSVREYRALNKLVFNMIIANDALRSRLEGLVMSHYSLDDETYRGVRYMTSSLEHPDSALDTGADMATAVEQWLTEQD